MKLKFILIFTTACSIFAFEANAQIKDAAEPTPEAAQNTLEDCVTFSGEIDQDCDGVADARATDYNSSRSNKSYSALDDEPDDTDTGEDGDTDYDSLQSDKAGGALDVDQTPDVEADDDEDGGKATDYNSSRSNKSY